MHTKSISVCRIKSSRFDYYIFSKMLFSYRVRELNMLKKISVLIIMFDFYVSLFF